MNRWFVGFAMFPLALFLGIASWYASSSIDPLFNPIEQVPPVKVTSETEPFGVPFVGFCDTPEYDSEIDYTKLLNVKLLIAGDLHFDEVPYQSGDGWLGLFKTNGGLELERTSIKVIKGRRDEPFSAKVRTNRKNESLFLLRSASILKPGPVETVYDASSEEYTVSFSESGNRKTFSFQNKEYVLEIDYPNETGGLQVGSALILKSGEVSQAITYLYEPCDDCAWSVDWVGDLDRDGKLDFLLDLSNHYNRSDQMLFLSSLAKPGKLVRIYAGLHRIGC